MSYICDKALLRFNICVKCGTLGEKIFSKEESIGILKILGLITNIEEYHKIYNHVKKT